MSKEPRAHDDGRNERQRAQAARDQRQPREDDPNRLAGRPDDAVLRDDASARQRIAFEKDEPGFVERMAEERQRPDFIERTLPEDPSDHYGQLTRDNVNPDIPSSKTREGWIADPNTLQMDQSQQGEQPPQAENQPEQWPQRQKVPSVGEYDKGEEGQQPKGKAAPREGEAPIEPLRQASINEPPGSNVIPGVDTGPNTLPGDGTALPPGTELPELTLTDIDPDRIPVQPEEITEKSITVTGSGFTNACVVLFDDEEVPTTFVSPTQLKANVPIAPAEGAYDVEVQRGDDLSDVLVFEIVPAEAGSGAQAAKREKQKPKPKKSEPAAKRSKKSKTRR